MKWRKNDSLWKGVIEDVFPDLLQFIFPDADRVYNLDRGYDFLDKELGELHPQPDERKDTRFVDKLVKLYHIDGVEEWVLLHIEVQGDTTDREAFAERMFTYFYRIRDRYPGKLVSAWVLFTGKNGRLMPRRYTYEYQGTRLVYEYPAVSIADYSEEELDKSENPFAQVILAARMSLLEGKVSEKELLRLKLAAARRLRAKGFSVEKTRSILRFLRNYVLFESDEDHDEFDNLYSEKNKTNSMNWEEYDKWYAQMEALERFVKRLLRKTDFTVEQIADIADTTVEFVEEAKEEVERYRAKYGDRYSG